MRKRVLLLLFIVCLLATLIEARAQDTASQSTNPLILFPAPPYSSNNDLYFVRILSPSPNGGNYSNPIQLVFLVRATGAFGEFDDVGYSLDGSAIYNVTNFDKKIEDNINTPDWYDVRITAFASISLPQVSEGTHNVTVYYGNEELARVNPNVEGFLVIAYASANFTVVSSQTHNLGTPQSDIRDYLTPEINISSPLNKTINYSPKSLNFTLNYINEIATNASASYQLDGNSYPIFDENESTIVLNTTAFSSFNIPINRLSDGFHSLTVYSQANYLYYGTSANNATIIFSIDTTPPTISSLSIENKSYAKQQLPLSFTTNESTSWISYSLDNQANVTINGNTTLTNLTLGTHTLRVFANDTAGNMGESQIIEFTMVKDETWLYVIVIVTIVAVTSASILIYFKKTKKK
jgi:hypothetical protein